MPQLNDGFTIIVIIDDHNGNKTKLSLTTEAIAFNSMTTITKRRQFSAAFFRISDYNYFEYSLNCLRF